MSEPERVYRETLKALLDSQRSPEEMAEATAVLNAMLDVRAQLDEIAARILKAAQGARDARSGMGVDLCLDYLRLAYDDAKTMIEGTTRLPRL